MPFTGPLTDLPAWFHLVSLGIAAMLLIAAAISDAKRYTIPNKICFALVAFFPLYFLSAPYEVQLQQHAITFGLMLVAGFAMFAARFAGAGDAKLLAAVGLWTGPHYIGLFLVITAISGGILAAVMGVIFARRRGLVTAEGQGLDWHRAPIPYGIAIALGGVVTLMFMTKPVLF
jgi:prepilin peptidase CpaA